MRTVILVVGAALAIASCGRAGTIVQDRPVRVSVPVAQPCAEERPQRIVPLKSAVADWYQRDARQKAALVGKQVLDRRTYGEQLDAATAACP